VESKLPCPFSHVSSSRQHQAKEELRQKDSTSLLKEEEEEV
jgi:hypothetical protein